MFMLSACVLFIVSCAKDETDDTTTTTSDEVVIAVDPTLFIAEGLSQSITKETRTLSNG